MSKPMLVTQAEFARIANVNRSTVTRWIKSGRIQATANGLIDPAMASQMRESTESPLPQHQARKDQIEDLKASQSSLKLKKAEKREIETKPQDETKAPQIRPADQLLWHKTELLRLEIQQKTKTLIERAQAESVLADFAIAVRASLEGMPDRISHAIAAHRGDVPGVQKELEGAINDVLVQVSDLMQRKSAELAS